MGNEHFRWVRDLDEKQRVCVATLGVDGTTAAAIRMTLWRRSFDNWYTRRSEHGIGVEVYEDFTPAND